MRRAWAARVLGALIVLVGLGAVGVHLLWFLDGGNFGTGAELRDRERALAAVAMGVAAVAAGVWLLVVRRRSVGVAVAAVVLAVLAAAAPLWYLRESRAVLVGLDGDGTVAWRTTVPVTRLTGVRTQSTTRVVVEGVANHHDCTFDLRSITVDRRSGAILRVVELPTSFRNREDVPAPPTEPDPAALRFEQGSSPVVCHS